MVRSITGPSKQISTYVTNNSNNLAKGLSEIASKRISNSSTSNSSKGSAQRATQIITDSRSAVENGLRSYITNRESNSSSNNSTNIRSDNRIIYGVDSSSIGGTTINNLYSTNSMDGVRIASLDSVEISDESRQLYVAKSSNKWMDIAENIFDIATDFIPGIGTAKDIYNVYKTLTDSKSSVKDVAWALADLIPGPSLTKLKKLGDVIIDKYDLSSSISKKLKDALVKTTAKKIGDMDLSDTKKLINASEGRGLAGHTKRDHVDITDEDLQARSKTKAKHGASKFSSQKVMNEFVNTVLVDEADEIATWLKGDSKKDFAPKHKSKTPLGYGYKYDGKGSYKRSDKLDTGVVVLQRDDSNEYGFIVKTAYPYVR
ncbi:MULTISPECIES: RNase A-like domain-containing protein [Lysinibacillus]|uniref:RNase A-like domain-containing protein n=1 Tax=Lysinibacillus xylanilyticus TaxID=582475 RepID=A0ABV3W4I3_9BACI